MARLHGAIWALMNSPDEDDEFALMSKSPACLKIPKSKSCSSLNASLLPPAITRTPSAAAILSTALWPGSARPSKPIPIPILRNHPNYDIICKGPPMYDSVLTGYSSSEDDDKDMLPPHEIVKRSIPKNRMAYSMCEGVGRTLKGLDLINFRTKVLTMTGYLQS